mmetsp:Transcript_33478/g.32538  ORF Transcript_33478/g.32538 Transcript_33478/m.32538 type:complete len:92 (+) Transcript_33478:1351-1626(+)
MRKNQSLKELHLENNYIACRYLEQVHQELTRIRTIQDQKILPRFKSQLMRLKFNKKLIKQTEQKYLSSRTEYQMERSRAKSVEGRFSTFTK